VLAGPGRGAIAFSLDWLIPPGGLAIVLAAAAGAADPSAISISTRVHEEGCGTCWPAIPANGYLLPSTPIPLALEVRRTPGNG